MLATPSFDIAELLIGMVTGSIVSTVSTIFAFKSKLTTLENSVNKLTSDFKSFDRRQMLQLELLIDVANKNGVNNRATDLLLQIAQGAEKND